MLSNGQKLTHHQISSLETGANPPPANSRNFSFAFSFLCISTQSICVKRN